MSLFKAARAGKFVEEEVAEADESEDETVGLDAIGDGEEDDSSSEEEEEEEDGADGEAAADGGATAEERQAARKRERRWERTNFVKKVRSSDGGTIYKTELVPELTFFSRDAFAQFADGRKYKRLLADMRRGMRTHDQEKKLEQKAGARRERAQQRRQAKRKEKRKEKAAALSEEQIDARKRRFQEKKERRAARRAGESATATATATLASLGGATARTDTGAGHAPLFPEPPAAASKQPSSKRSACKSKATVKRAAELRRGKEKQRGR